MPIAKPTNTNTVQCQYPNTVLVFLHLYTYSPTHPQSPNFVTQKNHSKKRIQLWFYWDLHKTDEIISKSRLRSDIRILLRESDWIPSYDLTSLYYWDKMLIRTQIKLIENKKSITIVILQNLFDKNGVATLLARESNFIALNVIKCRKFTLKLIKSISLLFSWNMDLSRNTY